ncbi:heparan-alpha-glucosaminide N-acetyltransferase domain-containing protein [Kutzneria viridogrisea]|uniref:DUF418 domain-containing protein n=2 Tax=Kutzneria TaxID=43356 RepID=W5WEB7_9PSEU|nr:DUF418 domain-containing protein [Kutzneria albida]AHH99157.1 hypothetical protein KALB_5796 [Kutzneria albida DSM 43870]MBA8923289.1 putative membrane protein YeiB [Kutzneria viridogrisea]
MRAQRGDPRPGRLVGIDLARGLAVFGMYAAHVGPDPETEGGVLGAVLQLAHGRSSALFAVLAGVSVAILTGRTEPVSGRDRRQAMTRIAIRAVILVVLGIALALLDTSVAVIIPYYGVYFLLALPLVRLRARALAVLAAVFAVVGPQLSFAIRFAGAVPQTETPDTVVDGIAELLVSGTYPAITWMPFVIAGMALGRIDISTAPVLRRIAWLGTVLLLAGYGGSWLALNVFGGRAALLASPHAAAVAASEPGAVSTDSLAGLLVATPHSGTTFEVLGALGCALLVVAGATWLTRKPRVLLVPVIAVGRMSLSAYVGHVLAMWLLDPETMSTPPLLVLLGFVLTTAALATLWSRAFRRGPLEHLLYLATTPARLIR